MTYFIATVWPERRLVPADTIARWYTDAVANQEIAPPFTENVLEQAIALHDAGIITMQRRQS
jgi:hypothetical protein